MMMTTITIWTLYTAKTNFDTKFRWEKPTIHFIYSICMIKKGEEKKIVSTTVSVDENTFTRNGQRCVSLTNCHCFYSIFIFCFLFSSIRFVSVQIFFLIFCLLRLQKCAVCCIFTTHFIHYTMTICNSYLFFSLKPAFCFVAWLLCHITITYRSLVYSW